jgi:hypothetical protein
MPLPYVPVDEKGHFATNNRRSYAGDVTGWWVSGFSDTHENRGITALRGAKNHCV